MEKCRCFRPQWARLGTRLASGQAGSYDARPKSQKLWPRSWDEFSQGLVVLVPIHRINVYPITTTLSLFACCGLSLRRTIVTNKCGAQTSLHLARSAILSSLMSTRALWYAPLKYFNLSPCFLIDQQPNSSLGSPLQRPRRTRRYLDPRSRHYLCRVRVSLRLVVNPGINLKRRLLVV